MPTNAELKESFDKHAESDGEFQRMQSLTNEDAAKSLQAIHDRITRIPTKDDTEQIVSDVIKKMLLNNWKFIFNMVLNISFFITAIGIIYEAGKWALNIIPN